MTGSASAGPSGARVALGWGGGGEFLCKLLCKTLTPRWGRHSCLPSQQGRQECLPHRPAACHRVWAGWQAVSVRKGRRSALQDINRLELAAEDILAADAEPLIEDRGIHLAEVGVMHQVVHRDLLQVRMR